ncbi:MAG: ATPase P [Desulfobacteraceae bacterium]|nr:MAG: ATPase P [Desulfobacteraceae bacterium]
MMDLSIPGYGELKLQHVVMDYNGTLAVDGILLSGVKAALEKLARHMTLHVLTADTFGKAKAGLEGVPCTVHILPEADQQAGKLDFVKTLGAEKTVSIGNGRNDQRMLKASRLGIAVILGEGASLETLLAADIVCTSIVSALELLFHPLRLTATLRS